MPVRFTCPHCQQLLSVSLRKIGHVVACPKCRGGLIVPAPLAGEVAGEFSADFEERPDQLQVSMLESTLPTNSLGQVQRISADVSPETIQTHPISPDRGHRSSTDDQIQPNRVRPPDFGTPDGWGSADHPTADTIVLPRRTLFTITGIIVGSSIASFVLGLGMGRSTPSKGSSVGDTVRSVTGRVQYQTGNGALAGDSEGIVVIVPVARHPDEKFQPMALRPEQPNHSETWSATTAEIRALGGDATRIGADGHYQLELPRSGEYFMLILSAHVQRDADRPPTTIEIAQMARYFAKADELLGQNAFAWTKQIIRADQTIDQTF